MREAQSALSISTHAPAQGATRPPGRFEPGAVISTHAPAQGATKITGFWSAKAWISTHAPAQGATPAYWNCNNAPSFQPTLPHRERRVLRSGTTITVEISTHAPAQGATM